ncbi:MAG: hypothetical protein WCZ28_01430 [Burkholderiaceae bacterium]
MSMACRHATAAPRAGARAGALLATALLATALMAGCQQGGGPAGGSHVEAWQADEPARFTFPPVGFEDFAMERQQRASLELVIHIRADGTLERLAARRVEGLDDEALETLFATIRHARFAPAIAGGEPVASIKRIALDFDPLADRLISTASLPDGVR